MVVHGSCAVRDGVGVLLLGPPGAGKSGLLLGLLDHGFRLVADDRVRIEAGAACAVRGGEGLLEVRGVGILCMTRVISAPIGLVVTLGPQPRLPAPGAADIPGIPHISLDPHGPAACCKVRVAVDCLLKRIDQVSGFVVA